MDLNEKAKILAQSMMITTDIPEMTLDLQHIRYQMKSTKASGFNSTITMREPRYGVNNLKNIMGQDKIHNVIVKNLSDDNKEHLRDLQNTSIRSPRL